MDMRVVPIGERVVLRKIESAEEKTKSGIILPKNEGKKEGIVEEVGQSMHPNGIPLRRGDRVIYGGFSTEELELHGQKYLIVELKDILAKIE